MTKTQEFILKNKKVLADGADFFNPDTSMMDVEMFEKSKLRVLMVFPTPSSVKSVSTTKEALNDIVVANCKDVFVDFAYMPDKGDIDLYESQEIPWAIGHITHLDASHFDIVGFSISVLNEVVTGPQIISTFNRCDKPIDLFWSKRKDSKFGEQPIIFAGGITAACGDIMYGKVGEEQAYMDFSYLGAGDKLDLVFARAIQAKEQSKVVRKQEDHDILGRPHEDKEGLELECVIDKNQDFIESLFDLSYIYHPQAYKVVFDDKNQIIENTKINAKAQDFVTPYYPLELPPDLGIGRSIINANGDGTGVAQVQVSEGAMGKGTKIRTSWGLLNIEDMCPQDSKTCAELEDEVIVDSTFEGNASKCITLAFNQGEQVAYDIFTTSGRKITLTKNHPVEQWDGREYYFKHVEDLKVGDYLLQKLGSCVFCTDSSLSSVEAEALGAIVGTGTYNKTVSPGGTIAFYTTSTNQGKYKELFALAGLEVKRVSIKGTSAKFFFVENEALKKYNLIEEYEVVDGEPQKYFPEVALQLGEDETKAFLRGFFESTMRTSSIEGKVRCSVKHASKAVVDNVAELLAMVGVGSQIRAIKTTMDVNVKYILSITESTGSKFNKLFSTKFLVETDFSHCKVPVVGECADKYVTWTVEQARREGVVFREDIYLDKVESIKETFVSVYDLTVPEGERLVANGFSVHNCSAAGSCSFCAEGNYTGGWVEKEKDQILKEVLEAKKYSAAYKFKPYSFNLGDAKNYIPLCEGRFKMAEEVSQSDKVLTLDGNSSSLEGIIKDRQPFYDIKLSRGLNARISHDHRQVRLSTEGIEVVKAHQLKLGDWIPQNLGYFNHLLDGSFHKKAYFLGLWFGDGFRMQPEWLRSAQCFNINEKDLIKQCRDKEVFRIFSDVVVDNVIKWTYTDEYTEYFKSIFPNYKYGNNNLTTLSLNELVSFIRGWFDADGDSSHNLSQQNPQSSSRFKLTFAEKSIGVARLAGTVLNSIGINFHLSAPIKVTLEDGGSVYTRYDLTITGLESRKLFKEHIGFTERRKLDKINDNATKWSDKDKTIPPLFGVWCFQELKKQGKHTGHNLSKFFHGIKGITEKRFLEVLGSYDIEPVNLVKSGLRFSQIESISDIGELDGVDLLETKNHMYLTEFGVTHNCNYVKDYKGMLYEFMKLYPKVTFINMRMEELGRDVDALRMMKLVGSNRISAPMEGISPRIQNQLLNKCLSEESLQNFMDDMVHAKMTDIKVGGIFTGYEEDQDFQWICDFVDKFKERASREGGNFPFRLKVTPLVHYQLTPCEYLERKAAKQSYDGEHWLSDEWYEKFRQHSVFFKVNGFRYSTMLEQCIIDFGRDATELIYNLIIGPRIPVYSLRSMANDEVIGAFKNKINKDHFFEARDPDNYISLSHRIHIDLYGSYVPRARRLVRLYKQGNIFANEPDIRCLKTYEGAKVKCYSSCIVDDPLKVYKDVKLVDGKLYGEHFELTGCTRCPTVQYKKQRLSRNVEQTKSSIDIESALRMKATNKVRFVINRKEEYDILNPNNTCHTFIAKLLQKSDNLLKTYYSMSGHSMQWSSDPTCAYVCSGYQIVDTLWTEDVYSEIKRLIPVINAELKSIEIKSVQEIILQDKIKVTDTNIYRFESTLPQETWNDARLMYDKTIQVPGGMGALAFEKVFDASLEAPIFISKGKVVGYFKLPCKYSPMLYLKGVLSSKRVSMKKIIESTKVVSCMTVRESQSSCSSCRKEKAVYNLSGKALPFGTKCLLKLLVKKETELK